MTRCLSAVIFLTVAASITGCGGASRPPLGYVSGIVSLDGAPLPGVIIVMKPDEGRMATAITDNKGYYNIEYIRGEKGTKIGPNTVSFEWPLSATSTKLLPKGYTSGNSTNKFDVKSGRQTFNIELKSDAPLAAETGEKLLEKPD